MKVVCCQMCVIPRDKDANIKKAREAIKGLNADIIVLPELFSVGYMFDEKRELSDLAEAVPGGKTTLALAELAVKEKCCIVAGVAETDGGKLYNTAVVVNENGYLGKYRKIHLTTYEKQLFSPGNEIKMFDISGATIGIGICYDLWFPEISRELMRRGTDILCVPANFGGPETPKIASVRAAENMFFTVLCNRVGMEQDAYFIGKSLIAGPEGDILAGDDRDTEETVCADIDPRESRRKSSVMCASLFDELKLHKGLF
jgi:predicted amidohydrolase